MPMIRILGCVGWLALAGCAAPGGRPGLRTLPALELQPLSPGVWVHTSYQELEGYGVVPSNGLVVAVAGGALLVDTAWDEAQTRELVARVRQEVGPIVAVVVTHYHDDRAGGLPLLHGLGVPSYGSRRTAAQLQAHGAQPVQHLFSQYLPLSQWGVEGEVYFAGAGHTDDNVVVWLRGPRVLFGGCLVKSAEAADLGNTADADVEAWRHTVEVLWGRYAQVEVLVPGHGAPGDRLLLAHTRALLKHADE